MTLKIHTVAFVALDFGIADLIRSNRVPFWFAGQRVVSGVLIGLGIMLVSWALADPRTWRLRAKIAPGHQLTMDGPFQFLRHPIYTALSLPGAWLRFGAPTAAAWAAFVLVVVGSDLLARAEETVRRSRVRPRLYRLLRPHQALHSRRLLSSSDGERRCPRHAG